MSYAAFGSSDVSACQRRNQYTINLTGQSGSSNTLIATEIPSICKPILRPSIPQSVLNSFGADVKFYEVPEGREVEVGILLGLDAYWRLMTSQIITNKNGLTAQKSIFGWVLAGPLPDKTFNDQMGLSVSHQLLCTGNCSDIKVFGS